jgi:hypothetical protein
MSKSRVDPGRIRGLARTSNDVQSRLGIVPGLKKENLDAGRYSVHHLQCRCCHPE